MKQFLFPFAFIAIVSQQHGFAQDSQSPATPLQLLTSYYGIKDALVNSDPNNASTQAATFEKTIKAIDIKNLPDSSLKAFLSLQGKLTQDAAYIAGTKDITHQREHFAAFSCNLFALAKSLKLDSHPIYYDYCPMKKAYWLSTDPVIKNPYFGSAMLTCGKTVETLN